MPRTGASAGRAAPLLLAAVWAPTAMPISSAIRLSGGFPPDAVRLQVVARQTAGAQDREYEVAWANTYRVGIQYTPSATRCGSAVINRHRAPASRHLRLLGAVPNLRAAAFRQSATEVGVEGLAAVAPRPPRRPR